MGADLVVNCAIKASPRVSWRVANVDAGRLSRLFSGKTRSWHHFRLELDAEPVFETQCFTVVLEGCESFIAWHDLPLCRLVVRLAAIDLYEAVEDVLCELEQVLRRLRELRDVFLRRSKIFVLKDWIDRTAALKEYLLLFFEIFRVSVLHVETGLLWLRRFATFFLR